MMISLHEIFLQVVAEQILTQNISTKFGC